MVVPFVVVGKENRDYFVEELGGGYEVKEYSGGAKRVRAHIGKNCSETFFDRKDNIIAISYCQIFDGDEPEAPNNTYILVDGGFPKDHAGFARRVHDAFPPPSPEILALAKEQGIPVGAYEDNLEIFAE